MVVPIFAPMIIPTAPLSFKRPAFTSPTTITVVADDDCTAAVTNAPKSIPENTFPVIFARTFSISPPEAFSSPELNMVIPYKNRPSPPAIPTMLKILKSIHSFSCFFHCTTSEHAPAHPLPLRRFYLINKTKPKPARIFRKALTLIIISFLPPQVCSWHVAASAPPFQTLSG